MPITVVIPAYRRPLMVARAVRSVLAQSRPPAEIIVVDDASGDDTGDRAAELGAQVITHDRNRGEGGSRNTGIEAASHDWVALLDCDDEWLPNHLATVWEARTGHVLAATAALGTGVDPAHHRVYGWTGRRPRRLVLPADVAIPENKLAPSAALLNRRAALDAGGFRDLSRAADLDMWIRMLDLGPAMAIPKVTALYHVHAGQVSTDSGPMHEAHAEVLLSHRHRPGVSPRAVRRHEGIVAWDAARAALDDGAPTAATLLRLVRGTLPPQRACGVGQLLTSRFRGRRMAARLLPGGAPSTAILPGSHTKPTQAPGAVDLRNQGWTRTLIHLLRRPPAYAYVSGPAAAFVVRRLGIEPKVAP